MSQITDPSADNSVRDFGTNPSINDPKSYEEARLAVIQTTHRSLADPDNGSRPLHKPFTTDMGFGMKRTREQAGWLEDARQSVLAQFGHVLQAMNDDIDLREIREARGQ